MTSFDTKPSTLDEKTTKAFALDKSNERLSILSAEERVAWSLEHLPHEFVMTSSFGAQAAATLALVTEQLPSIPVILVDTGYLFPETYRFVDELVDRLNLNLKVYKPETSSAWQEARYGERWTQGVEGLNEYNQENKVRPLEKALRELNAKTWFAGLRKQQSGDRNRLPILQSFGERWKVHPILDWTDKDVHQYLTAKGLPYHPLWEKGYVSIGDVHTTKSLAEVDDPKDLRFFGLKRECGIHEIDFGSIEAA